MLKNTTDPINGTLFMLERFNTTLWGAVCEAPERPQRGSSILRCWKTTESI